MGRMAMDPTGPAAAADEAVPSGAVASLGAAKADILGPAAADGEDADAMAYAARAEIAQAFNIRDTFDESAHQIGFVRGYGAALEQRAARDAETLLASLRPPKLDGKPG